MEWLERMNRAIDYIEDNLDNELDITQIAKEACCSACHFQRIFAFAAEMTLSEYIRLRRMTLAAFELQNHDNKVIDIALKYGYNSPTAFTRAFTNVHGVTPKTVREKGISLKSFPRISFHISIKGGKAMNYRIVEKPSMRFVGKKETVSTVGGQNFQRIPVIWQEVFQNGMFDKIYALSDGNPPGVMGICANFKDEQLDYYIASASGAKPLEGMDVLEVPAGLWVIFQCVGPMPQAIQDVWKRVYTEWFPSSGYEHAGGAEIEWYSEGDSSSEDYISEIWIPIIKK
ncbi:AraC family transcriptional regulator [Mobilitalea sibirica]|uniref:AraC family transcriptional regulator n=1 Tax=Mobilitalea sibirica TaxID=1462919 RepID=A0A8J7KSV1_9FIRM|nr:AraC family transcriptional regulator [Mobilitalea sibirica]MBH1940686.1 AraC family transcriptional regulator [Mobilitalea sibirica]